MEFEVKHYIVYVKTDSNGYITAVNSSAFLTDTTDWTEIDSGYGDKYHHAQANYFPTPSFEEHMIPLYKLEEGKAVERTQEEIDADIAAIPSPEPSALERIEALEKIIYSIMERMGFK